MAIFGPALVVIILAVVVFFCGREIWKGHKSGGCGGGCSGCSGGSCSGCSHHQPDAQNHK